MGAPLRQPDLRIAGALGRVGGVDSRHIPKLSYLQRVLLVLLVPAHRPWQPRRGRATRTTILRHVPAPAADARQPSAAGNLRPPRGGLSGRAAPLRASQRDDSRGLRQLHLYATANQSDA